MFWRKRKTSRTGPLLLAVVDLRLNLHLSNSVTPDALARQLQSFHVSVEKAARSTGGDVVQFVGGVSVVAWRRGLETGGCDADPIGIGRTVLADVRRSMASGPDPSWAGSRICVGLALGDCVYEERRGRVLSVMGHAWLRILRDFKPMFGGDDDAIVLDNSLRDALDPADVTDVGGGWHRASGHTR